MINNRYSILYKAGEGRNKVFCCLDRYHPGMKFAIKVLDRNAMPEDEAAFYNEYGTLLKLNHPNIIKVSETSTVLRIDENEFRFFGIEAGSRFFVMEYFEGAIISEYRCLKNQEKLISIISQLCSTLLYLHHSNYTYNDLKAENILITEISDEPVIKFVDFELCRHMAVKREIPVAGTFHYLAPEILSGKPSGFSSDLFSLGVLIYKLVYDRFPFDGSIESEILESILCKEPAFAPSEVSDSIINIIKKLLAKDAGSRYSSPSDILKELEIDPERQLMKLWQPAKYFADRTEAVKVEDYLTDESRFDVLLVRGVEGSGKTSLLKQLAIEHNEVIYIGHSEDLIRRRQLLEEIIFHPVVYNAIGSELLEQVIHFLNGGMKSSSNAFTAFKLLLIKICSEVSFTIVFDDFSRYDTYTMISLIDIILLLQSKKSKVIIADTHCSKMVSENICNISEIGLNSFNKMQLRRLLEECFPVFYPTEEICNILLLHSDLIPGRINSFVKNLYENEIFEISGDKVTLKRLDQKLEVLATAQSENYRRNFHHLSQNEKILIELCSMFSINIDAETCSLFIKISPAEINDFVHQLMYKGVFQLLAVSPGISFVSENFKAHIYSEIEDKKNKHLTIAQILDKSQTEISCEEIARQYEYGGDYERSFDILWSRLQSSENKDSLMFQKELLLKISEFRVDEEKAVKARIFLCRILQKLGENKLCLELIKKYFPDNNSIDSNDEIKMLEGICLIELGELEDGKLKLEALNGSIANEEMRLNVLLNIAYAELDLGQFENAYKISRELISSAINYPELLGKGYNLSGLIELYHRNNLSGAIDEFNVALNTYKNANLVMQVAAIELNIGNIYNMLGDYGAAQEHWETSLAINSSVGNLDQEAKLLLSLGIFFYDKCDYSLAVNKYNDAQFIFANMGNKVAEGLTLSNLGEVYLSLCDYSNSFASLTRAKEIFTEVQNLTELIEVEFLFGKFFYHIGDINGLSSAISSLQKLTGENSPNEKYERYLQYLIQLKNVCEGKIEDPLLHLKDIKEAFYAFSNKSDFLTISLLLSELFIQQNLFKEAAEELNDNRFDELSIFNVYAKAERNILLSIIAAKAKELLPDNRFDYLGDAYSLIEEQHINEVTWKVLYYLAESFAERGNFNKAAAFAIYAIKLIEFIAGQIEDVHMHQIYLDSPERKLVLHRLKNIQGQISCR